MIDLRPAAMQAQGLSPSDIVNAVSAQNLILPAGTSKIGQFEYDVDLNASPRTVEELNDLPVKATNGTTIYIHDVANVRDGFSPQTNVVRRDGMRGSLLTVQKVGATSTLDIVQRVKDALPAIRAALPPELRIEPLADQSLFVRAAVNGVIREAVIAACLTAMMILLFLGSWRSTLIIAISIPLSILTSIVCLSALGETINIMTLGGLALAVGILVDDATVTIENIERNFEEGKDLHEGILDGAAQIAVPALVSTLCICIVFIPMFFLTGVARYLFIPLAEAVVFAMLASYVLSRTLVPTLAMYLLRAHGYQGKPSPWNIGARFQKWFERSFNATRDAYHRLLTSLVEIPWLFLPLFLGSAWRCSRCFRGWGRISFLRPTPDKSSCTCAPKRRCASRKRANVCDQIEAAIRRTIPQAEVSEHHRQHRIAVFEHQSVVQHVSADRDDGFRHSGFAQRRSSSDGRLRSRDEKSLPGSFRALCSHFCRPILSARF